MAADWGAGRSKLKYFVVIWFFWIWRLFLFIFFLLFLYPFIHSFSFISFFPLLRAAVLLFFLNATSLLVISLLFLLVSRFSVQFLASRFPRDGRRGARDSWW